MYPVYPSIMISTSWFWLSTDCHWWVSINVIRIILRDQHGYVCHTKACIILKPIYCVYIRYHFNSSNFTLQECVSVHAYVWLWRSVQFVVYTTSDPQWLHKHRWHSVPSRGPGWGCVEVWTSQVRQHQFIHV